MSVIDERPVAIPAPRRADGAPAPADLVVVYGIAPAAARRALRDLDCVRAVVLRGGGCRAWADPGTAHL